MVNYRIGIDIGGTTTKLGIVTPQNEMISQSFLNTNTKKDWRGVIKEISEAASKLLADSRIPLSSCAGVGIGSPGAIDSHSGTVVNAYNLNWKNVPAVSEFQKHIPLPAALSNDANCAALGEVRAGSARGCLNAVLVTLGTGVGGGVIIDGKIFEGGMPGAIELGHTTIKKNGEQCTCGRKGCLEAYTSATALIRDAKKAVEIFPDSLMAQVIGNINCKQIFDAAKKGDLAANGIVYNYILNLAEGITDFINIFRPEKVILGGGIGKAGKILTEPLKEFSKIHNFGGKDSRLPEFVPAALGNNAGIIGAANLISIE